MKFKYEPITRDAAQERLRLIFPREAFDTTHSGPAAAATVAMMIYVEAVFEPHRDSSEQRWVRPLTIMLGRGQLIEERVLGDEREAYYRATLRHKAAANVAELLSEWEVSEEPWYEHNTRETVRDDVLRKWLELGIVETKQGIPNNYSGPRWALREKFAGLFDLSITGEDLVLAIDEWTQSELSSTARIRLMSYRARQKANHAVLVTLPSGVTRQLESGNASNIIKGVIEQWAPLKLGAPLVLAISEPGEKTAHVDSVLLSQVGISIDAARLLPDLLIADGEADPVQIWVIEVVFTDGEINEARKAALLEWGQKYGIAAESMRFMTAFESRASSPAKRRLKDLASDTFAWYLDEPDHELYFGAVEPPARSAQLALVTQLRP